MINILREYSEGDTHIIEYTRDGKTVSHIVEALIKQETGIVTPLSIEEQILYETQYQTTILEMGGM